MLVYDPFMGSGTTALACLSLNIDYIGTEIDTQYIDIAEKNIEERVIIICCFCCCFSCCCIYNMISRYYI